MVGYMNTDVMCQELNPAAQQPAQARTAGRSGHQRNPKVKRQIATGTQMYLHMARSACAIS